MRDQKKHFYPALQLVLSLVPRQQRKAVLGVRLLGVLVTVRTRTTGPCR